MRDLSLAALAFVVLAFVAVPATAQVVPSPAQPQLASLAGVVRDTAGAPISDAEVVIRDQGRGTRSGADGRFTLANVAAGTYHVWFRRLGYASVEYTWAARPGERTDVTVSLVPIPRALDPVVVRADEDRRAAAHASILGMVVDSAGMPIPEAEVQLVGANLTGVTRAGGEFLFKPLAVGTYIVRVRKLGFAPNVRTVQLVENDDREVVIRLHRLATQLDAVTVYAESGYGEDNSVWEDFEQRRRWASTRNRILGPEDLKAYYSLPLDLAEKYIGMPLPSGPGVSLSLPQPGKDLSSGKPAKGDMGDAACILINGREPVFQPLRVYGANEVEVLEIYPSGTEPTGTVSARFRDTHCRAVQNPDHPARLEHPTYYVLWLKK